jgi:hypothetical protein
MEIQNFIENARKVILGMAFNRNKCEERITSLSGPIMTHIIKVCLYSDPVNYSKHIDDIDNWLSEVWQIKSKGFTLKEADYYEWLWGEKSAATSRDSYLSFIRSLDRKYGKLTKRIDPEALWELLPHVYRQYAKDLSKGLVPTFVDPVIQ